MTIEPNPSQKNFMEAPKSKKLTTTISSYGIENQREKNVFYNQNEASFTNFNPNLLKQEKQKIEGSSEETQGIDIKISNVVCKYRTRCHIPLREVAKKLFNTELDKQHGRVEMRLRQPKCCAHIWASGKISIYGANSERNCHVGARRIARLLQKVPLTVKMCGFEIRNVMGSCKLPFEIDLPKFYEKNKSSQLSYEPELHSAANYKFEKIKANLKIFSTGAITATATNVSLLDTAIQEIYPMLEPFKVTRNLPQNIQIKLENFNNQDNFYQAICQPQLGQQFIQTRIKQEAEDVIENSQPSINKSTSNFRKTINEGINRKSIKRKLIIESDENSSDIEIEIPYSEVNTTRPKICRQGTTRGNNQCSIYNILNNCNQKSLPQSQDQQMYKNTLSSNYSYCQKQNYQNSFTESNLVSQQAQIPLQNQYARRNNMAFDNEVNYNYVPPTPKRKAHF